MFISTPLLALSSLLSAAAAALEVPFDRSAVERQPSVHELLATRYFGTASPWFAPLVRHVNPVAAADATHQEYNLNFLPQGAGVVSPYDAVCTRGNFYPSPNGCTKYFQCNGEDYGERECPNGLHWDQKIQGCNWPKDAKCELEGANNEVDASAPDNGVDVIITDGDMEVVGASPEQKPVEVETAKPVEPAVEPEPVEPVDEAEPVPVEEPEQEVESVQPVAPVQPVQPAPAETGMKVVCYFTNWATYRPGGGKYQPEDIDPALCTHINYGFAVLDKNKHIIKIHDAWADVNPRGEPGGGMDFFGRVIKMKEHGAKVLLALGGWNDSKGKHYSVLVSDPAKRARFIEHAVAFLKKYGFDGLDLDWEYPVCWQTDCKLGPESDKDNFSLWAKELKEAFDAEGSGLMLTAALSPSPKIIDIAYDIPEINKYLDIFNVMTYDFYGAWDKATGHHSPLYHFPGASHPEYSANNTMQIYARKGATKSKLVMGMPTYGRNFQLKDVTKNGINQTAVAGQQGQYTRSKGFVSYYEVCTYLNQGYQVVQDPEKRMGPYAFKGNQWVGYEDPASIEHKSNYIKANGFGGAMIWALDLDDFNGQFCNCGRYPLLSTINRVLRNYQGNTQTANCPSGALRYTGAALDQYSYLPAQQVLPSQYQQVPVMQAYRAPWQFAYQFFH